MYYYYFLLSYCFLQSPTCSFKRESNDHFSKKTAFSLHSYKLTIPQNGVFNTAYNTTVSEIIKTKQHKNKLGKKLPIFGRIHLPHMLYTRKDQTSHSFI